jgi:hypothetical protein
MLESRPPSFDLIHLAVHHIISLLVRERAARTYEEHITSPA